MTTNSKISINSKKDVNKPIYYALQSKDGHLFGTITGKILVTTHKIKMKGYKVVELVVKK
jgi:hypothetical protein